jgi:hypothetical protein
MSKSQDAWIEAARKATGARPVTLHKVPRWAYNAMRAAIAKAPTDKQVHSVFDAEQLLAGAYVPGCASVRLFDHWGTSKIERDGYSGPSLVTEPYAGRDHIEGALCFADWLGCEVEIGMASWWYPNNTVRIEFYPGKAPQ